MNSRDLCNAIKKCTTILKRSFIGLAHDALGASPVGCNLANPSGLNKIRAMSGLKSIQVPKFKELKFCTSDTIRQNAEAVWDIKEYGMHVTITRLSRKEEDWIGTYCAYSVETVHRFKGSRTRELAVNQKDVVAILQSIAQDAQKQGPCARLEIPTPEELHFGYHPCIRHLNELPGYAKIVAPFEVAFVYLANRYAVLALRGQPTDSSSKYVYGVAIAANTEPISNEHGVHIQTIFQALKPEHLVGWMSAQDFYIHLHRLAALPVLHESGG